MSVYITGCEKDADRVFHDSVLENRYDSTASTSNSLLDNINFDQDGNILVGNDTNQVVLQHASIEYQKKLSNYYNELGDFDYWNNFYDNYGTPKWDISIIINSIDSTKYNIIVPVLKNNNLTAIIVYSTDGEKEIGNIYSKEFISEVANIENPNMNIIRAYLFPIGLYQLYDYIISGRKNDKLLNWVNSVISKTSNTRSNDINYRAWCIELEIIDYYTLIINGDTGAIIHFSDVVDYTKYIYTYVPCEGPPPFDGGDHTLPDDPTYHPPHHGGDSTGGDDGEDIWDCAFALEGFMANWKIKQMIAENSLTDPCHPEKTTRQIIAKAIYDKCNKKGADNLGTVDDFLKDLGDSGDYIYPQPSFANNDRLECLFNKLLKNESNVICNTVMPYKENAWHRNVDLYAQPFHEYDTRAAITNYDNEGRLYISLNTNDLDAECNIEIQKTLIHEFIHADIKAWVKFNHYNFENDPELKKYWDAGGDWEHEYMAGEYHDEMVQSLKDLYGDKYTQREYEAIVWSGLHKTKAFENSGFTIDELNSIIDNIRQKCTKSCTE